MPVRRRARRVPIPREYVAWWAEAGAPGLRHALAEAVGHADQRFDETGLSLFDPRFRGGPALPPLPDPAELYQRHHPERRAKGVFYTPDSVVDWLVAQIDCTGTVFDPACGGGAFLRGVLRAEPPEKSRAALGRLRGQDLDPLAVWLTQAILQRDAGKDRKDAELLQSNIVVGDSLRGEWPEADAVLTNPPFLTRLKELTMIDAERSHELRARLGAAVGPYTDISAIFLALSRRHGRKLAIVLPASICATRDAAGVRASVGPPTAVWCLPKGIFPDVGVPMVAAVFDAEPARPVERWAGLPPHLCDSAAAGTESWSSLIATDDDPPAIPASTGLTLGEIAHVEADFRDEYYHLRGHIFEAEPIAAVRVFTSGLIGLGASRWGQKNARIHRASWSAPVVRADRLHPRQASRTGELVLVATQTSVIQACIAASGSAVGLTPVITVRARDSNGPWNAAAILTILLSPFATAWAQARHRGAALTLDTIKLSAAQLRALPIPPQLPEGVVRQANSLDAASTFKRSSILLSLARSTTEAYGGSDELTQWWARRARLSK